LRAALKNTAESRIERLSETAGHVKKRLRRQRSNRQNAPREPGFAFECDEPAQVKDLLGDPITQEETVCLCPGFRSGLTKTSFFSMEPSHAALKNSAENRIGNALGNRLPCEKNACEGNDQ
jgi:hypothetical protein